MNVDTEILYLTGLIFAAMLAAMAALVRTVGKSSETNASINGAMIKQSETIIAINNELQEHSRERQQWQIERVKFEAEIKSYRHAATAEAERFDRQFKGLMSQIAQVRQQRDRLQGEFDSLKRRIDQLEAEKSELVRKVAALENENRDLKGERQILIDKVDTLIRRLDQEVANNHDLRCEIDKLRDRLKDLPSTDDLTDAAAKVAAANLEPGESKAPEETDDKMSEEQSNE